MKKTFVALLALTLLASPALSFAEEATTTPTVDLTPIVATTTATTVPETISAEQQAKIALEAAKAAELAAKEQTKKALEAKKLAEKNAKEQVKKALEAKKTADKVAKEAAKKAASDAKIKAKKDAQAKFATCMQAVIEARDNSLIAAIDKNREALKNALVARMTSQKEAIKIEDKVARNAAWNKSWSTYRTSEKNASTALRTSKQASWSQFEKAKKSCGDEAKSMTAPKDITSNNNTL